jgi:hypothetical protein
MKNGERTVPITLEYFNKLHADSYGKLMEHLEISREDKNIIMTHFPPLMENTSHPKYSLQDLSRKEYFANNFQTSTEVFKSVSCWISGHTHYSYDFLKGDIRFLSNQLGYLKEKTVYRDIVFNL